MSKIEEFFEKMVESGAIKQLPSNYDAETLKIYIDYLENKNEKLRNRLEKSVELPCKVGDTVYSIEKNCDNPETKCKYFKNAYYDVDAHCEKDQEGIAYLYEDEIICDECKNHLQIKETKFDLLRIDIKTGKLLKEYCLTKESAEARLAELKGENDGTEN